jgi:uncharacterized protein
MNKILKGKGYAPGIVEGEVIVSRKPFGFWQGIDTKTGIIVDARHDLVGESIKDKVFVYPFGRGSTANSGVFVDAVREGNAPAAIINVKTEPMIIVSAILGHECFGKITPVIDSLAESPLDALKTGDRVRVDGAAGTIEILS